jgi:putative transposase
VEGVSPRKAKEVTEELCGTTFSKSLISSLAGSLDSELSAWRNRRLEAEAYPYLFVDARYEKVRVDGRVVSQGVLVVSGVRADAFREILAVEVANTESEAPTRTSSGPRSDEGFREWSWWSQMTTKA